VYTKFRSEGYVVVGGRASLLRESDDVQYYGFLPAEILHQSERLSYDYRTSTSSPACSVRRAALLF